MRAHHFFILLLWMVTLICAVQMVSANPSTDRALHSAERRFQSLTLFPKHVSMTGPESCGGDVDDIQAESYTEIEKAFQAVLDKHPHSVRAYIGLGKCQTAMGDYADARKSFRQALRLSTANVAAKRGLQEVQAGLRRQKRYDRFRQKVDTLLPKGYHALDCEEYPVQRGRNLWLVVAGKPTPDSITTVEDARLRLFEKTRRGWKQLWRSDNLEENTNGISHIDLSVFPLLGRRTPQVVVQVHYHSGSYEPCDLHVFTWRHRSLRSIANIGSYWPLWIEDLNQDGHYEIGNYHEIGDTELGHTNMPVWTDIYAYRHGRYLLADRRFPALYRGWPTKLRQVTQRFSQDFSCLAHLGLSYEIIGNLRSALTAYRKARRCGIPTSEGGGDGFEDDLTMPYVQKRIRILSRIVRPSAPHSKHSIIPGTRCGKQAGR